MSSEKVVDDVRLFVNISIQTVQKDCLVLFYEF